VRIVRVNASTVSCYVTQSSSADRISRPAKCDAVAKIRISILDRVSFPDILSISWAGHVARLGEARNAYRILVGKPEGKRPLGKPMCRWVDNIVTWLATDDSVRIDNWFIPQQC
jgi:hypothetical protein